MVVATTLVKGRMSSEKETAAAAADVSSAVTDPVVVLKNSGNSEYAKANYATAMESFNTAISIMKERLKGLDEAALALISNSESSVQSTESREESAKEREKAVEERNSAKELAATLFCNRSMCHSALSNWSSCVDDSRMVSYAASMTVDAQCSTVEAGKVPWFTFTFLSLCSNCRLFN